MKKKVFFSFLVIILLIVIHQFLYGKLFAYSLVVLGFSKYELKNTIIYVQSNSSFDKFLSVDSLTEIAEGFHHLKFKSKPQIYIFSDSSSYLNRSVTKARFYVYPNGKLFVSPWAVREDFEEKISLIRYIQHELSHTLLYQNMGIIETYKYPQWLMEGIAVYYSKQMGTLWYPNRAEMYAKMKEGNFIYPKLFKTAREDKVILNVQFRASYMYCEFACLVDYLISKYGEDKFLIYVKNLMESNDHDEVFKEVFMMDFNSFIEEFRVYVNTYKTDQSTPLLN